MQDYKEIMPAAAANPNPVSPSSCEECRLPCSWSLYCHTEGTHENYKHLYHHLCDMHVIGDWLRCVNSWDPVYFFLAPHEHIMIHGKKICTLSLFRKDVRPEWEDSENACGSTITMRVPLCVSVEETRKVWDDMVCDCIRGGMHDAVVGFQMIQKWMKRQPCVKFDVWLADCTQSTALMLCEKVAKQYGHVCILNSREVRT